MAYYNPQQGLSLAQTDEERRRLAALQQLQISQGKPLQVTTPRPPDLGFVSNGKQYTVAPQANRMVQQAAPPRADWRDYGIGGALGIAKALHGAAEFVPQVAGQLKAFTPKPLDPIADKLRQGLQTAVDKPYQDYQKILGGYTDVNGNEVTKQGQVAQKVGEYGTDAALLASGAKAAVTDAPKLYRFAKNLPGNIKVASQTLGAVRTAAKEGQDATRVLAGHLAKTDNMNTVQLTLQHVLHDVDPNVVAATAAVIARETKPELVDNILRSILSERNAGRLGAVAPDVAAEGSAAETLNQPVEFNPTPLGKEYLPQGTNVPETPESLPKPPTVAITSPKTGKSVQVTQPDLISHITELLKTPEAERTPAQVKQIQEAEKALTELHTKGAEAQANVKVTGGKTPTQQEAQALEQATPTGDITNPQVVTPEQIAQPAAPTSGADISANELNQRLNEMVDAQKSKYKDSSLFRRAEEKVNPYAPAARIDKNYAKALGIKHTDLPKVDSLEALADKVNTSATQADTIARKAGMNELVQHYPKEAQRQEFMNYLNARFAVEVADKRGLSLIRDEQGNPIPVEALQNFVASYEAKNPNALSDAGRVKSFYDQRLQDAAKAGVISQDDANFISSFYQNYVPLQRVFPEDLARPDIAVKPIGTLGRQTVVQQLEGSGLPLNNDMSFLFKRNAAIQNQINRSNLFNKFRERVEQGVVSGANIVQSKEQVLQRQHLQEQLKMLQAARTKIKNQSVTEYFDTNSRNLIQSVAQSLGIDVQKVISNRGRWVGRSINGTTRVEAKAGAPTRVLLHEIGHQLDERYGLQEMFVKNPDFKKELQKLADLRFEGAEPTKSFARYVRKGEEKIAVMFEAYAHAPQRFAKTAPNTYKAFKSFLESHPETQSLLNLKPSLVLGTNRVAPSVEKELAGLDEQIAGVERSVKGLGQAAQGVREEAWGLATDSTTGRQVITGPQDGIPVKIEVTPEVARLLGGIGDRELGDLAKGFQTVTRPFRAAWTGVAAPIFNMVSAAIYDPVAGFIVSKNGTRALTSPKAWEAFFKSFNNSSEFRSALQEAGAQTVFGSKISAEADNAISRIAAQRGILSRAKFYANPKNIKQAISAIDEFSGKLTSANRDRFARVAYDAARRDGATHEQALAEAAYDFNNVLPNFRRSSHLLKEIDTAVPYTSASIAGTRSLGMAVTRRPVQTLTKLAVTGIAPTAIVTFHNLSQPNGKNFYDDMEKSGKTSLLNNNLFIVLPWAKKDPQTGQWTGVLKIPTPPELRALNKVTWRQTYDGVVNNKISNPMNYAQAAFDTATGQVLPVTTDNGKVAAQYGGSNPLFQTAQILSGTNPQTGQDITPPEMQGLPKDQQVYDNTSGLAKLFGKAPGLNPLKAQALINQFGATGRIVQGSSPITELKDRFTKIYGDSAGKEFFKNVDQVVKDTGLNKNEEKIFYGTIMPSKKDAAGNVIKDKTYYDSAAKAIAYLQNPKLFQASKQIDAINRKNGEAGDPIYDLSPDQLRTVLNLQATFSPGNKEDKAITKLNPWLTDFYKQRSAYFDKVAGQSTQQLKDLQARPDANTNPTIKSKIATLKQSAAGAGIDPMGMKIPKASSKVQSLFDQSSKLSGKDKAAFYQDNPELTDYLTQTNDYQRAKRSFLGLPQFDEYPTPDAATQKLMTAYSNLPKGNGPLKRDGTPSSPDRSNWIKTHPNEWATIGAQYDKIAAWNAADEGSLAVYEGIGPNGEVGDTASTTGGSGSGSGSGNFFSNGSSTRIKIINADGTTSWYETDPTKKNYNLDKLLPSLKASDIKAPVIDVKPRAPKLNFAIPAAPKRKRVTFKA